MTQNTPPVSAKTAERKKIFIKFIPPLTIFLVTLLVRYVAAANERFADLFTLMVSHYFREFFAALTSLIPFSVTETVLILLVPTIALLFIVAAVRNLPLSKLLLFSAYALSLIIALQSLMLGVSYSCTPLASRLGLDTENISIDDLKYCASALVDDVNMLSDSVSFDYGASSRSDMTLDELSDELVLAYEKLSQKFGFVRSFDSRIKPFIISDAVAALRISGLYCYYTGEANVSTTFPDYTVTYSAAHEMAHQRGFAKEDEANFVAYLVSECSDNAYIKYASSLNLLQYLINTLAVEDPEYCSELISRLDLRIRFEFSAYGEIYDKHSLGKLGDIMSNVNDGVLKSQGVKSGEKSYSEVVKLAAAYFAVQNS